MYATKSARTAGPRPRFRGAWERSKDARAERRMRLAAVVEAHGADALDVIRLEDGGSFPFKSEVYVACGVSLVGLARLLHGTGRLRRVADGVWVVTR